MFGHEAEDPIKKYEGERELRHSKAIGQRNEKFQLSSMSAGHVTKFNSALS